MAEELNRKKTKAAAAKRLTRVSVLRTAERGKRLGRVGGEGRGRVNKRVLK